MFIESTRGQEAAALAGWWEESSCDWGWGGDETSMGREPQTVGVGVVGVWPRDEYEEVCTRFCALG